MTKLTKKQKGFVKDYVKTENGTQAVMKHYDVKDETVASSIATENLRKPYIKEAIQSIADRIPDELLEKTHLEGLEATVGEDKPDYSVRHKYLDSAYKLKGSYAPDKNININMNVKSIDPTDETILNSLKAIQERLENE
tara:strand:+ start:143 stop:559 length:417 start_codon:yes stop_codon:yes gene_type:complete